MTEANAYSSADIARARLGTMDSTALALEAREAAASGRRGFFDQANDARLDEYRLRRAGIKPARIPIWKV